MAYHSIGYFILFVPLTAILYSLFPVKNRWMILLGASYVFFWLWSGYLLLYNIACSIFTWYFGMKLAEMRKIPKDVDRRAFQKKRKRILTYSVLVNILVLIALKYTNFLGESICEVLNLTWTKLRIAVPIGISYYTLQAVSYLADVLSGKAEVQKNPLRLGLYLSYFPILVEGPISRYGELEKSLYSGAPITYENLCEGFQRILWGVFKKIAIADYLTIVVDKIFENNFEFGSLCLFGAVLYTIQLYCDFSGTIDVVIGSSKVFGITLSENFRQPFFAKDAGDFWRRWHMTLGSFLRDYVFYPVTLSKPVQRLTKWAKKNLGKNAAKLIGPLIALTFVWLSNGFWHGASWNYIMYGVYYFFILSIELVLKEPVEKLYVKLRVDNSSKILAGFRFVKLIIIVIIGETLFRSPTVSQFITMFCNVFTNWNSSGFKVTYLMLGIGRLEYLIAMFGFCIVIIADVLNEKGISFRKYLCKMPAGVRWTFWYLAILYLVFFGAYGPGYDAAAMMYAGF